MYSLVLLATLTGGADPVAQVPQPLPIGSANPALPAQPLPVATPPAPPRPLTVETSPASAATPLTIETTPAAVPAKSGLFGGFFRRRFQSQPQPVDPVATEPKPQGGFFQNLFKGRNSQ